VGKGETLDTETRAAPYVYAANGALKYVNMQMEKDGEFQQKQRAFLDPLKLTDYDIRDYETLGSAKDAFMARAKSAGATYPQAEAAWEAFRNKVLDIDRITRLMREDVVRADPAIVDALQALHEQDPTENYAPPQWALELAGKTRGGD
jgi:hypothetical protein